MGARDGYPTDSVAVVSTSLSVPEATARTGYELAVNSLTELMTVSVVSVSEGTSEPPDVVTSTGTVVDPADAVETPGG